MGYKAIVIPFNYRGVVLLGNAPNHQAYETRVQSFDSTSVMVGILGNAPSQLYNSDGFTDRTVSLTV